MKGFFNTSKLIYSLLFLLFWANPGKGQDASPQNSADPKALSSLLVLEPVDISSHKTSKKLGENIREILTESGRWKVFTRKETVKKLGEYSIPISRPCREYNCAFDAGNMFHANYVLFSTISQVKELYAFNLVIIDVLGSKIAWSHAGEVNLKSGKNPHDALLYRLENILAKLRTEDFLTEEIKSKGVLGVINFNANSAYSKIISERLSTHIYSTGHFEIMGPSELGYLIDNLKVKPSGFEEKNMREVGSELGLDYMIYLDLKKQKNFYNLRLSLYDIQNSQLIRDWPYQSPKFRSILAFEEKFAASLNKTSAEFSKDKGAPGLLRWKWAISPGLVALGSILGYVAWNYHEAGNREFDKYQEANTLQELEQRSRLKENVSDKDGARNIYGFLGLLSLSGGVVLWYF